MSPDRLPLTRRGRPCARDHRRAGRGSHAAAARRRRGCWKRASEADDLELLTTPLIRGHTSAPLLRSVPKGETETTPLIVLSGLVLGIGVLLAIVIVLVFLIAR